MHASLKCKTVWAFEYMHMFVVEVRPNWLMLHSPHTAKKVALSLEYKLHSRWLDCMKQIHDSRVMLCTNVETAWNNDWVMNYFILQICFEPCKKIILLHLFCIQEAQLSQRDRAAACLNSGKNISAKSVHLTLLYATALTSTNHHFTVLWHHVCT